MIVQKVCDCTGFPHIGVFHKKRKTNDLPVTWPTQLESASLGANSKKIVKEYTRIRQ